MFETAITFIGGTAFRLIFGSVMDWFKAKQDHQHEMDMLRIQSELDAQRHNRDMERIQMQSALAVKEIQVVGDVAEQKVMADAFLEAVKATGVKTGIGLVDAWNASIRPAGATFSLVVWIGSVIAAYFAADAALVASGAVLTDFDRSMISAFLGVFVGDRIHSKGRL
jgi:hypothetical protein